MSFVNVERCIVCNNEIDLSSTKKIWRAKVITGKILSMCTKDCYTLWKEMRYGSQKNENYYFNNNSITYENDDYNYPESTLTTGPGSSDGVDVEKR